MKPWITLSYAELRDQWPPGEAEDVHFTESLARVIITEFSIPGDLVLDPSAGFGTTPVDLCFTSPPYMTATGVADRLRPSFE